MFLAKIKTSDLIYYGLFRMTKIVKDSKDSNTTL